MKAAAGPGFLDHRPDWYNLYEYTYFLLMRGGAPSKAAAEALAQKIRDRIWRAYEGRRSAADRMATDCPFDLNALFPVPHAMLDTPCSSGEGRQSPSGCGPTGAP